MARLKIPLYKAITPDFQAAFRKLMADSAVIKADPYALARSMSKIEQGLNDFNSARTAIGLKHGKRLDSGNNGPSVEVPQANFHAFQEEMKAMIFNPGNAIEIYLEAKVPIRYPLPPDSRFNAVDLYELEALIAPEDMIREVETAPAQPA